MKHLFVINPKAGKGEALDIIPKIKEIFKEIDEDYIIEITKKTGHATELVRSYVSKENYRVYAVGGDGTLNEVLNGMVNTESCLGVIPNGSGNDFIKSIYEKNISDSILEDTINGKIEDIDLVKVDNRYFINIGSVGIDAEVVNNAKNIKSYPFISGEMAYIISAIITIFKYKCNDVEVIIDGVKINTKSTLLAFANGKYYGGGIKIAPYADLKDGLLDICVINKLSKLQMLMLFPKLIKGRVNEIKEVSFYKGKKVKIISKEETNLNLDGEILRRKNINFELVPRGVKFIIPKS